MRICRLRLLRSARKSALLGFVTVVIYVIVMYNILDDVTKHTDLLAHWAAGYNNINTNNNNNNNSVTTVWTPHQPRSHNASKGGNAAHVDTPKGHDSVNPDWRGEKRAVGAAVMQSAASPEPSAGEEGNVSRTPAEDPVTPETLLLAGTRRDRNVEFTIGMVTVSRDKEIYFFDTLTSLLARSTEAERREITIVIMLADRNETFNSFVLNSLKVNHARELEQGVLLVLRGSNTNFLFRPQSIAKRTYNDSLDRVQWRSKQNLDYAALMEFCAPLSTYYLHLEDDVTATAGYIAQTREFIRLNSKHPWAMLELCPHGFIGKLFHSHDLAKLVAVLRAFYLEQPCDFLIKPYFINMMTQPKPILSKVSLFLHRGKYSSLKTVTRKVDRAAGSQGNRRRGGSGGGANAVVKVMSDHKNPAGKVYTDMTVFRENLAAHAYDLQDKGFFWAVDIKEGQYVSILFDTPQRLERVQVETGFSKKKRQDILQHGSVEVGRAVTGITHRCEETQHIGDFQDGRLDIHVTSMEAFNCINIVVKEKQSEWLVIREIYVFTK